MNIYTIAGLKIGLNFSQTYIHSNFTDFLSPTDALPELKINLIVGQSMKEPSEKPLIVSSYLVIYGCLNGYQLFYPNSNENCSLYYDIQKQIATIFIQTENKDSIFYSIRDIFFLFAQQKKMLAVHSSSLIYRKKAYLFSASSGTGKTTHTSMWMQRYGTEILNGDVTCITIEDGIAVAYGIPWCGTSNQFLNQRIPVGGIIFLSQSCHNSISKLTKFESTIRLAARSFSPTWTTQLAEQNLSIAEAIASCIPCAFLECRPDQEAIEITKDFIDSFA